MTMWNNKSFTENELSKFTKVAVIFLVVVPVVILTIYNIVTGEIANPYAFSICIVGLVLFIIPKISLFRRGLFTSFGTKHLTQNMKNLYRLGYWLMAVGLIYTFLK